MSVNISNGRAMTVADCKKVTEVASDLNKCRCLLESLNSETFRDASLCIGSYAWDYSTTYIDIGRELAAKALRDLESQLMAKLDGLGVGDVQ